MPEIPERNFSCEKDGYLDICIIHFHTVSSRGQYTRLYRKEQITRPHFGSLVESFCINRLNTVTVP